MEIRKGWSTEYAKTKFDVTVDETDLQRLRDTWEISQAYRAKLTTEQVFAILDSLAEWLSVYESMKLHQAGTPELAEAQRKTTEAQQNYWSAMQGVRLQLSLDKPQQAAQSPAEASGDTASS